MGDSLGNTTEFSTGSDFSARYGNTALRFYLLEVARSIIPDERIKVCWRYPLPERKTIEIIYSEERKCARTKGTMKCGSGWVCPACMSYIAARRREELQTAVNRSSDRFASLMATYTVRHHAGMPLNMLLSSMVKAYGKVFEGGWWSRTKEDWMIRGAVRATEITWGANGWHPHFHVLMFVDKDVMSENLAGSPAEYVSSLMPEIGARWIEKLESVGLSGDPRIAFDLRSSDQQIAEYISKWGRMPQDWELAGNAWEVAHAATKNAEKGHFGPLEILFKAARDSKFRGLFLEYHHATKGKSQLHWSKGLKTMLDIEVIKDELAAEGIETETDRLLAEIPIELWRYIADRKLLGQIMTYANEGNEEKLSRLIEILSEQKEGTTVYLPQMDIGL